MTQSLNWDELLAHLKAKIGAQTPPTVTEIDKSTIRAFAAATGASSRLYTDEAYARSTRYGSLIAPPAFVSTFVVGHIPDIFHVTAKLPRTLHTDDQVEIHAPIRPGDTIKAYARYAGAQRKDGRQGPMLFQTADLILARQDGAAVANVRITSVSF
jgi:acyl dehydratase